MIYALAASLAGEQLSQGQQELLAALCRAAEAELTARLRPGITAEQCADALVPAAAWTALAGLAGATEEAAASFRVGDVSVTRDASAAGRLLEQAERLMAPWSGDGGFAFREVRG